MALRGGAGPGDTMAWPGPAGNTGWVGGQQAGGWAGGRVGSWMCPVTVQLLKSADLGRQSLLYLKEIGHGWFGKVSGEGRAPPGTPRWDAGRGRWGFGEDRGDEPVPCLRCSWGR